MKIQPIKRVSVSEQVFAQLRQGVIEGEWRAGEKLPSENELADSFGVSRVTIRHAIHNLVALGLAETRPGGGTYIKLPNPGAWMQSMIPIAYLSANDTIEVLDFRYVLEIETVGLAVERCNDDDVNALRNQLSLMLKSTGDFMAFSSADLDFHAMIAKITRNSLIVETSGILREILDVCMRQTVESLGVEIGIPFHQQLIMAFEERDAEKAKDIMRAHMDSTRCEFMRALGGTETNRELN